MPAWVTSLNLAPPSGPIRESRWPRLSRASGPAPRPERVRTRRPTASFQPLPGVQSGEPSSLCGLAHSGNRAVASAVSGPGRAVQAPNPRRPLPDADARASPPPPPLPGAGIPATCSRDRPACRGRMTRRQEQPLGGARAPRLLARFSFSAPGPGLDAACSRRARAPVSRLSSAPLRGATLAAPRGAGARLGPLPHS